VDWDKIEGLLWKECGKYNKNALDGNLINVNNITNNTRYCEIAKKVNRHRSIMYLKKIIKGFNPIKPPHLEISVVV